jgi:hypothetical protein
MRRADFSIFTPSFIITHTSSDIMSQDNRTFGQKWNRVTQSAADIACKPVDKASEFWHGFKAEYLKPDPVLQAQGQQVSVQPKMSV